jgi:C4-dicarboxylate-specific signal transduction histidine kinase
MDHPFLPPAIASDLGVIDSLGIAALALDEQDCTLRWNQEFLRLFPEQDGHIHVGEPYAENLRRFYRTRLDPREMAHIETYVADGVERHRRQITPYEFEHHDRWIRVEVVPLPAGVRLRLWTPASPPRDSETLATHMVEAGKKIADGAVEQLVDGLILRDAEGRIILANRRIAETYGLATPMQAIGKSFPELLDLAWAKQPLAEDTRQHWADNLRFPGSPFELPLPGDRWVRVRERRTHDGILVSTHVDVTDLFRLQRSASEARQRAEELAAKLSLEMQERKRAEARMIQAARLASIGEMATGLAHEIRQPLQSMSLSAELAQLAMRRGDAKRVDQRLEDIVRQTQKASDLVEHLRRFARVTADRPAQTAIPLGQIVESTLQLARGSLQQAMIDVEVVLGEPAPTVVGDAILLEQVLLNLLLNARDALATRPDGAARRIRIAASPEAEGRVRLAVADTGGGIAAEVVDRVFEPFVTTKGPDKGTGLGLSICYG